MRLKALMHYGLREKINFAIMEKRNKNNLFRKGENYEKVCYYN